MESQENVEETVTVSQQETTPKPHTPWLKTFTLVKYLFLLIENPKFRYLWLGYLVSIIGDLFSFIANVKLINLYAPENASIGVALYLVMQGLPSAFISPISGILADRFDRKIIMLIADICRVVGALNYLWVRSASMLWLIFVIAFLQSVSSGIFDPSRGAMLPNLISDPDQLILANSLDGSTWSLAAAIGSATGGLVVALLGTDANFIIDSCTYLISALCIIRLMFLLRSDKVKEEIIPPIGETYDQMKENIFAETDVTSLVSPSDIIEDIDDPTNVTPVNERIVTSSEEPHVEIPLQDSETSNIDDYQHVDETKPEIKQARCASCSMVTDLILFFYHHPDIFLLCFLRFSLSSVWGGVAVAHIKYVEEEGLIGNNGSLTLGIYYSVIGIGAFSGPLIVQRFCDKTPFGMRVWFVIGLFVQMIGTTLSAFSFHISWMLIFGAFVRPIGESMSFMIGITLLQRLVPDHIRGRVFAFSGAFLTIGQALSGFGAGIISDVLRLNLHIVLYIFSAINVITFFIWLGYLLIYGILRRKGLINEQWLDSKETSIH